MKAWIMSPDEIVGTLFETPYGQYWEVYGPDGQKLGEIAGTVITDAQLHLLLDELAVEEQGSVRILQARQVICGVERR